MPLPPSSPPSPSFFLLLLTLLLTILPSVTPSPVNCTSAGALVPTLAECSTLLDVLNARALAPGGAINIIWGRYFPYPHPPYPPPNYVKLPFGFYLMRTNPYMEPNHCELLVDNFVDRREETDIFGWGDLVIAGRRVVAGCVATGQVGRVDPTGRGLVSVGVKWRRGVGDGEEEAEGGGDGVMGNVTMVGLDAGEVQEVQGRVVVD